VWLKDEPAARRCGNVVTDWCSSIYEPLLRAALRRKTASLIANGAFVILVLPLIFVIGREFMPQLYEGSLLYMPTAPPGLSITGVTRAVQTQDRVLMQFPEVERVFGTAGGATTASDNSPLSMVNTTITLKPRAQWRRAMTMDRLQAEMDRALQFAGFPNVWTQPIRSRVDMLSTGLRTPIGVKVLGAEVTVLQQLGEQIERTLKELPGTRSAFAERSADGFFLDIRVDRAAISRYGLTVEVVQDVVQTAIGGNNVDRILEGRERYPINIRYQRDFRDDIPALERVLVRTADGQQVPLGRIAAIAPSIGPAMIRNENGFLAEYVYVDTEQADLAGYVARARDAVARRVRLPAGYSIEWSGQFESMARASRRLRLIVPIVLVAIFVLLYAAFGSLGEALMIMASVVFAMTGGLVLQWLLGYRFSVAVWIGYIALFGVAVQTGVVMVIYLQEALEQKMRNAGLVTREDVFEATVAGAVLRLRPKLMTVGTTVLGLLPIMWSTGAGSDVMKPIAAPILGGMLTSAVHVLLITPLLFYLTKSRALARTALSFAENPLRR
jgi:copper/silver efflux system protein